MPKSRWIAPWADSLTKPAFYHWISRVVDRRFVFGDEVREHFRMFIRMQENFTGCRVLSYCVMSNHFYILLQVPPIPEGGISHAELLRRLSCYSCPPPSPPPPESLASARIPALKEAKASPVAYSSNAKAATSTTGTSGLRNSTSATRARISEFLSPSSVSCKRSPSRPRFVRSRCVPLPRLGCRGGWT
jgi:hypothetical protein